MRINWTGSFPDSPKLTKPFHISDNDAAFRRKPVKKVVNSDAIIAHMKRTGKLNISTGDAKPDYAGKTEGVFLNQASTKDPQFTISKTAGAGKLVVTTGYSAPYGAKVRIGDDFIAQGYPMRNYSDHKMHIYDPIDQTLTEIQFIEEVSVNPLKNFLLSLFGKGGKQYHCHGVTQYSLKAPSGDPSVKGSSAANIPIAETTLRYENLMDGWLQMSSCGVPAAHYKDFVAPAQNTDGPARDADAVRMGQLLVMRPDVAASLKSKYTHPLTQAIIDCWSTYGIMVIDTSAHITFGLEPDKRIPQDVVKPFANDITLDMFEVWTQ